jgi:hypothetical protein
MTNIQFINNVDGFKIISDDFKGSTSFITELTTATGAGNGASVTDWASGWSRFE